MKHIESILVVSAFAAAVVLAAPQAGRATDQAGARFAALESDPVEAGREALGQGRRPWYDAEADSTQRIELSQPFEFPEFGSIDGSWAQSFAWATLALLAVLLVAGVVYAFVGWQRPMDDELPDLVHGPELAAARSELLPVRAGSSAESLRAEAQEHLAAGRYGEAVVCLYSYGLLTLDALQMIHLARGKTNRQYLRELSRHTTLREPMRQMVETFEGYFFGGHDVSRERCQQCLAHVSTIQAAGREVHG